MNKVFINYRREDTAGDARALFNYLQERMGKNSVFMDQENIPPGRDYRSTLEKNLESCGVMLVLIGKHWADALRTRMDKSASESSEDWVCVEIAEALKRKIPVVPVLVQGADMPAAKLLSKEIENLTFRQAWHLSSDNWKPAVEEMIRRLHELRRWNWISSLKVQGFAAAMLLIPVAVYALRPTPLGDPGPVEVTFKEDGPVDALAFSPDGYYLATASDDNTARVFETATGKEVFRRRLAAGVDVLALSPHGRFVATASDDNTARVFETATGKELRLAAGGSVDALAFSPDGRFVTTTTSDDNTSRVFETATGKELFSTPVPNVLGLKSDDASNQLKRRGFMPASSISKISGYPSHTVIEVSPEVDSQIPQGSAVTLTVAQAPGHESTGGSHSVSRKHTPFNPWTIRKYD
jgi:hypothetical protein